MQADVIFIGAGVAARGAAWRLQQAGMKTLVLEQNFVGYGASGAAAGMLAPSAELQFGEEELLALELESLSMWPALVQELELISELSVGYRTQGTLALALDQDDARDLERRRQNHLAQGLEVFSMSTDELRKLEPSLSSKLHSGLYLPNDHQIDPLSLISALTTALRLAGGVLREHTRVEEILHTQGKITGVKTRSGQVLSAPQVIIATGAWREDLSLPQDIRPPHVRPIRGQMLSVELGSPPLCQHVLRAPHAYLVPKNSGALLIGSTMEEMGFDASLTAGGIMDMLVGAWEVLPGIHEQRLLDMWTGFRPVSLDNMPHVERCDRIKGLLWSTGHGRQGILLTPWTAKRLSELVLNG